MGTVLKAALLAAALAVTSAATAGCGSDGPEGAADDGRPLVVAATPQLADLAANVAGERAAVEAVLDAEADPHDYEPRPSDAERLLDADLILRSGGDLDLWVDELIEGSGSEAPVLTALDEAETIEGGHEHEPGEEEGGEEHATDGGEGVDPHWWQDPRNAALVTEAIGEELAAVDPGGAARYRRNAAAYVRRVRGLDREIAACMDTIPAERRKLITTHDALGYYAHRYDIEVVGATIPALTTQAQPSAGETAELVRLIREEQVATIFPEAGVSPELETAIAEEAGATVGPELWVDTLGPAGSDGETYLEAIASNSEKLAAGFGSRCEIEVG